MDGWNCLTNSNAFAFIVPSVSERIANQVERYFMQAEGPAYLEEDPRWREKWARAQEGDARWARFFEDLYWLPRRR